MFLKTKKSLYGRLRKKNVSFDVDSLPVDASVSPRQEDFGVVLDPVIKPGTAVHFRRHGVSRTTTVVVANVSGLGRVSLVSGPPGNPAPSPFGSPTALDPSLPSLPPERRSGDPPLPLQCLPPPRASSAQGERTKTSHTPTSQTPLGLLPTVVDSPMLTFTSLPELSRSFSPSLLRVGWCAQRDGVPTTKRGHTLPLRRGRPPGGRVSGMERDLGGGPDTGDGARSAKGKVFLTKVGRSQSLGYKDNSKGRLRLFCFVCLRFYSEVIRTRGPVRHLHDETKVETYHND